MLDPAQADQLVGDVDPATRYEAAHVSAAAIVHRGRAGGGDDALVSRLVSLVDAEGIDTLAALWSDSPADSLPGALWRLYLMREWVRRDAHVVAERYRLGAQRAEVADVIVGVESPPGPHEVARLADAVLSGVFTGELDVALDRCAAFFRVLATGTALDADVAEDEGAIASTSSLTRRASALQATAEDLRHAAELCRAGRLE